MTWIKTTIRDRAVPATLLPPAGRPMGMSIPTIKTASFLSNLPIFRDLAPEVVERLAAGTEELRVPKGHVLFRRGDPCTGFHAVVFGQVKLAFTSPSGSEKVVDIIGPGQTFGEALMFSGRPYVVYGQCLADSLLVHISGDVIDAEMARDPGVARVMLASLSSRLIGLIQDVEAYSLRSGMQRVIGYLLRDLDENATSQQAPTRVVLDANKGVIASRLNLTPEHFSRILGELSHEGAISVHGSEIILLDAARLRGHLD